MSKLSSLKYALPVAFGVSAGAAAADDLQTAQALQPTYSCETFVTEGEDGKLNRMLVTEGCHKDDIKSRVQRQLQYDRKIEEICIWPEEGEAVEECEEAPFIAPPGPSRMA